MFNNQYPQHVAYWSSVGIDIVDAAALLGVHSLVDNLEGGDPPTWNNMLFQAQVSGGITVFNQSEPEGPEAVTWTHGIWKFTPNEYVCTIVNSKRTGIW